MKTNIRKINSVRAYLQVQKLLYLLFILKYIQTALRVKQIAITYEPETVEDQEIIDSYGGLDNTPAYLVRLRPVLKVNGERIVVGTDGLPMGSEYDLTIELISPNGTEKITDMPPFSGTV